MGAQVLPSGDFKTLDYSRASRENLLIGFELPLFVGGEPQINEL